ncbi:MAG: hypothetical protein QOE98_2122 [Gaiellaceae bacterium]|jgi:hypothetical protein|nr:hypothetical protein [Gaiellaceae bacterium]
MHTNAARVLLVVLIALAFLAMAAPYTYPA